MVPALLRPNAVSTKLPGSNSSTAGRPEASPGWYSMPSGPTETRVSPAFGPLVMRIPSLTGTVVTQFQISPQGVVQGATAAGMGDKGVEDCVAEAIRSIQFPKPKGGGFVNVRYPFIFQPAGG